MGKEEDRWRSVWRRGDGVDGSGVRPKASNACPVLDSRNSDGSRSKPLGKSSSRLGVYRLMVGVDEAYDNDGEG